MEQEKRSESSLITIASFTSVHQAQFVESVLDAAQIPAVLDNEHIVSMNWTYSNAVGVKVLVESIRADEARLILATPATEIEPSAEINVTDSHESSCTHCGGTDFDSAVPGLKLAILSWLVLGWPLGLPYHRRFCRSCGAPAHTK